MYAYNKEVHCPMNLKPLGWRYQNISWSAYIWGTTSVIEWCHSDYVTSCILRTIATRCTRKGAKGLQGEWRRRHLLQGDYVKYTCSMPQGFPVVRYVYIGLPQGRASNAEIMASVQYIELMSLKIGPFIIVETSPSTATIDEDFISNKISIASVTLARTPITVQDLKEMPTMAINTNYRLTQRDRRYIRRT